MKEKNGNPYYYSHTKGKSVDISKKEQMNFKVLDQRQTIDSTKEIGTSEFSNMISSIHKEEQSKIIQNQYENWIYRSFAVENNTPIYERVYLIIALFYKLK